MIYCYARCDNCNREEEDAVFSDIHSFTCDSCSEDYCTNCTEKPHACSKCKESDICDDCMDGNMCAYCSVEMSENN